jgi:hypothetical protein
MSEEDNEKKTIADKDKGYPGKNTEKKRARTT